MAWVSPKVYAILSKSEEGKDILEGIADKSQEEVDKEVDAFFGKGGKGYKSNAEYSQAKMDDEEEENAYKSMGDEEVAKHEDSDKREMNDKKAEDEDDYDSVYEEYNLEKDGIEEKLREEFDLSNTSKKRVVDYIRENFGVHRISDATEIANDILGKRDFSKDFYAEIENHKNFNELKEKLNELKDLDYSDDKYGDIWYDKENLLISIENDLEKTFGKKIKKDTIEKYIKSKL